MPGKIDQSPLGILAGEGDLPIQLTRYCVDHDIPVCVLKFDDCHYDDFPAVPQLTTKIEQVGEIYSFFRAHDVQNVVMIGALNRPSILSLRPDLQGFKTLSKILMSLILKGDDTLLRSLKTCLEHEGFTVKGITHYLPNLLCDAGCLTNKTYEADLTLAVYEAQKHGVTDKGQSILWHGGNDFSYEDRSGTAKLIQNHGKKGSVLVKVVKPQQDVDLDRPVVGLETLKLLYAQGCSGLVIQAQGVMMVNKHEMIEFANDHDLFIEVINV